MTAHNNEGHRSRQRRKDARHRRRAPQHKSERSASEKNTLHGRAARALSWDFASTILTKFSLFAIGIMLARLLGPHAFGAYAVAYVALTAVLTFNELGVSLAIVRWEGDPVVIAPTITTISLLVSISIYAACFLCAPAYASAMGAPDAIAVVRVLALVVLSDAFTNTPAALLQRTFRQGRRVIADQVNVWLGTLVTVLLALTGHGAMSLAIGRLAGCIAGASLLVAFAPGSLRLGFSSTHARALLRFGLPLAGANVITFAVANVDQIIVGHVLGTVALGFYVLALNLSSWPLTVFSQPVRTVGPAVFARLQHDRRAMRLTFFSAASLLCASALPVCLLIAGSAKPLISFVYGSHWAPAVQPLTWLCLLGAVQVFFLLAYDYLVVLARSRFLLVIQLLWLLALVPALIAGARIGGIYGAGLAEAAVAALGILPWYLRALSKLGIQARALISRLWLPIAGAALAGTAAFAASTVITNDFAALAVSGVTTVSIMALLIYRIRSSLAMLRSHSDEIVSSTAQPATLDASNDELTNELASMWGVIDAAPKSNSDRIQAGHRAIPSLPDYVHDLTGPLPLRHADIPRHPGTRSDLALTSPLYRMTVASMQWDPAENASRNDSSRIRDSSSDVEGPRDHTGPQSFSIASDRLADSWPEGSTRHRSASLLEPARPADLHDNRTALPEALLTLLSLSERADTPSAIESRSPGPGRKP